MRHRLLILGLFIVLIISGCVSKEASNMIPDEREIESIGFNIKEKSFNVPLIIKNEDGVSAMLIYYIDQYYSSNLETPQQISFSAIGYNSPEEASLAFEKHRSEIRSYSPLIEGKKLCDESVYSKPSEITFFAFLRCGKVNVQITLIKRGGSLSEVEKIAELVAKKA